MAMLGMTDRIMAGPQESQLLKQLTAAERVAAAAGVNLSVDATLTERGSRYGTFKGHAQITQELKNVMRRTDNYRQNKLRDSQVEALEMIFHKVGRILNGDPNYADSWHDIAGYAKLVDDELNGKLA